MTYFNIGLICISPLSLISCSKKKETVKNDDKNESRFEISSKRYDFEWSSTNADVSRPKTIAELKSAVPNYYDSISNELKGDALFKALQTIQSQYRSNVGTYTQLWNHYDDSFLDSFDEKDNTIMDMYGEVPSVSHGADPADGYRPYKKREDQDGTSSKPNPIVTTEPGRVKEGWKYNREHIIPQSYFRPSSLPDQNIKNDPHFVWPADSAVNSSRSNNHFAEVTPSTVSTKYSQSQIPIQNSYEVNGGILGTDPITSSKSYEPVDWFKGDIARAHFHFLVTWSNDTNFVGGDNSAFKIFKTKENMTYPYFSYDKHIQQYLQWNVSDPVDTFNNVLNDNLSKSLHSKNRQELKLRNPFIDMPSLAELIWN